MRVFKIHTASVFRATGSLHYVTASRVASLALPIDSWGVGPQQTRLLCTRRVALVLGATRDSLVILSTALGSVRSPLGPRTHMSVHMLCSHQLQNFSQRTHEKLMMDAIQNASACPVFLTV